MQSEHLNIRDEERHCLYLSRNAQTWSGRKAEIRRRIFEGVAVRRTAPSALAR